MSAREWRAIALSGFFLLAGCVAALLLSLPSAVNSFTIQRVLWAIRLPEALTALLVGGSLGLSGLLFQLVLRNDLADPYVLGVAGGGAFSAILVILFAGDLAGGLGFPIQGAAAFVGGFITLFLLLKVARGRPGVLLLGGVVANTAFAAASRLLTVWLSPTQLAYITAYLIGFIPTPPLWMPLVLALPAAYTLLRFWSGGRGLDLLLLSDDEASALGLNVSRVRKEALLLATLLACLSVVLCGMIGFVGLVVPHAARMVAGHRHRVLVPVSFMVGAAFLLFAHSIGKAFAGSWLLPVGVYTSLVGAPVFLLLLVRAARRGWS